MVGQIVGSGLNAIGSIVGQKMRSDHEKKMNQMTIQAQKDQAEYAYGKDLEQWERANAYNAPTEQMSRLRDAGLNPNMIYGGGAGNMQSNATLPKYQSVKPEYNYSQPMDPTNILGAFQDFRLKNAQIDNANSQAKKSQAEAQVAGQYYGGRALGVGAQADARAIQNAVSMGDSFMMDSSGNKYHMPNRPIVKAFNSKLNKTLAETQLIKARKELTDEQIEWYMYNQFGSLAVGAASKLVNRLGKAAKTKGGVGKLTKFKPQSDREWGSWKRLPDVRSTAFD